MSLKGAIETARRSCVLCSRRLNVMIVACASGSLSTISSMLATLSRAVAERVASIFCRYTMVWPSVGPLALSAARSSLLSTSTVCCHSLPLSVLGHQGRLTRILATDTPRHTLLAIVGTKSLISVSGWDDPVKNSITTFLVSLLGITGSGAVAVSGQVFADWRLRPPVGAARNKMSSSVSVAESLVPLSLTAAPSSTPNLSPLAPPGSSDEVDEGGARDGAPPVEEAPVEGGVLESVSLEAAEGSPREPDLFRDRLLSAARQIFFSSKVVDPESMLSALST